MGTGNDCFVLVACKYRESFIFAFSRNERTHPNFVSQAPEIQIFCEDCKLVPPLGFFRGFGLVVETSSLGTRLMPVHVG